MKHKEEDKRVKKNIMGWKEFVITYLVLLLLVGGQMGILVAPIFHTFSPTVRVIIVMTYWLLIASSFLLITNWQIRRAYDKPMRRLSKAAKKVAEGDFSVYVEPLHAPEAYDYIDVMFTDFNKMVQELGSIETLKNDFVANVSHELKTPLAIIKNYATMLKSDNLPQDIRDEYIENITQAIDNLSSLISNILKLNKLENGEILGPVEQYDICGQLGQCFLAFESLLDEKNIQVEVEIEDYILIETEKQMLDIVWNNLFSNAIKFMPENGTLQLKQTSEKEYVTVMITDTGCGMSHETLAHIFDKFYQGDTSHSSDGNGLGLALVHRIVERSGGTISVTSQLGKGSCFTVTLPTNNEL